jgi:hypothetical protein
MTITVRLDAETTKALAKAAKAEGLTKSEFIRRRLREYLDDRGDSRLAWELGKDLFGKYGSGRADLSEKHEEILREKFNAKQTNRRRRTANRSVRRGRQAS